MAQIIVSGFDREKRIKHIAFYVSVLFKQGEEQTVSAKYNLQNLQTELEEIINKYELFLTNSNYHTGNDLFNLDSHD